ncbi:MAG: outer membrane assembly protein [Candidatus Azobacteroides sp.]|nr:outer membrane assembly protein [Candidatus Azobacteroides sp.]
MKYFTGTIVILVILAIVSYFVLLLWGINLISAEHFTKSLITFGILVVVSFILTIIIPFFFKNNEKGYDMSRGNVAHPKNENAE